jgi:hypothetical protein
MQVTRLLQVNCDNHCQAALTASVQTAQVAFRITPEELAACPTPFAAKDLLSCLVQREYRECGYCRGQERTHVHLARSYLADLKDGQHIIVLLPLDSLGPPLVCH